MTGSGAGGRAGVPRRAVLAVLVAVLLGGSPVRAQQADAAKKEQPAAIPDSVEIFGTVVDDETGKPIAAFVTQAGKFEPKDPKNVTWGFSETRTSSSRFSATVKWNEGWTARILADGYVPQPVLSEAPQAGKARVETVIRMKKGRTIRGRVLDHLGKPVKDASLFAVRPMGMTLAGGKAVHSYDGEEDPTVRGTKTDAEGRFVLSVSEAAKPGGADSSAKAPGAGPAPSAGGRPGLAISSPALDAWPVPLPEGDDEVVIRLPAPTRVEIEYDIEGSDDEASVFLQSLMHDLESWKGFEIIRHLPVRNQGRIDITSLPPGKYQFARSRSLRHGNIGQGVFLDRQTVEVTSDKPTTVSFVRKTGARLSGSVEWDEKLELTGVIIKVQQVLPADANAADRMFAAALDARLLRVSAKDEADGKTGEKPAIVGHRGLFLTERIPPGTYEVYAEGYAPLTPERQARLGIIGPTVTARSTVIVPESGNVPSLKLELKKPDAGK